MRPRTCPHCRVVLKPEFGFHFDKSGMICDNCDGIVVSVETTGDTKIYNSVLGLGKYQSNIQGPVNNTFWKSNGDSAGSHATTTSVGHIKKFTAPVDYDLSLYGRIPAFQHGIAHPNTMEC